MVEVFFGKDKANGTIAYTTECLTKDGENMEVDYHYRNEVENFSPI